MNTTAPHPSSLLQPEWVKTIRQDAFTAEDAGMLQPQQLELIYEQQWFKMLVPEVYGGLEMPLPELIRLEEALSWADGSLGWVITLCAGAGWFGGFINPEAAHQIFAHPKVCLAGSGASTGTAQQMAASYIINGHWRYASGVRHATHFTANCMIQQNQVNILNDDGNPVISSFVIDSNQAAQVPAWKYIGMMGTGSHAFTITDAQVSANRSFTIDASAAVVDTLLYRYPFLQLAEATLAANLSGMAQHFIDLCGPIFEQKLKESLRLTEQDRVVLMNTYDHVAARLQTARDAFYQAIDASWTTTIYEEENAEGLLQPVSITSRELARVARESVDQLYPYCGLQAAAPDTEINQVWRDLHTASQHALLTFQS